MTWQTHPSKPPVATDGSSEAQVAARAALEIAQKTDSELHAIHVVDIASSIALLYPEATDPKRVESIASLYPEATNPERINQTAPDLKEALERHKKGRGCYAPALLYALIHRSA
jgi:nucleotide-binding universal stress UspA family protein